LCHEKTLNMAVELTRIPFSAVTHAVINRLKAGKSNNKVVHETTLELVVSPNHKLYMGDCHTCILYCEKCNQKFGLPGSIIKVLAEASNTILYHYGLELGELDESDEYENMNQQRFMNSLPMHTMSHLMGTFSTSIVKRLSTMNNQRCKYGTGNVLSRCDEDKNNYFLHALHEAMKIDTYFAGNDSILQQRANHTSCLLLSLFDVAHHRYCEDVLGESKVTKVISSFDDYGLRLESAIENGNTWITSNCDKEVFNQHRIYKVGVSFCHNNWL